MDQGPYCWLEGARWPEERQEQWAERAAIMEIDGMLSRDDAEMQTYRLVVDL